MLRSLLMSACGAILLMACESGTAPQSPTAEEGPVPLGPEYAAVPNPSFQPFAFTVTTCGEPVDVSGTFHQVLQLFVGPGGKQHFRFHINAKGTGVGQLTGARYQWIDRLFDITNIAPAGTFSFIVNDYARLIGQGGAIDRRLALQNKITVTAYRAGRRRLARRSRHLRLSLAALRLSGKTDRGRAPDRHQARPGAVIGYSPSAPRGRLTSRRASQAGHMATRPPVPARRSSAGIRRPRGQSVSAWYTLSISE